MLKNLDDQGIVDQQMIQQELQIFEYKEREEAKKVGRQRMGMKKDPYE